MSIIRPDGWAMTSTFGFSIAFEDALGQLGARLAAADVERRDDEVERRQELVRVVELAVGADLELAAVQQAEALGDVLGRRVPASSSAAKRLFSAAMSARSCATRSGVEAAGDRERLRVVGHHLVGVAAAPGELGHDLDRLAPSDQSEWECRSPRRSASVTSVGQPARERRLDLAAVLAQLGLDERQAQERVRLGLGGERPELAAAPPVRISPSSPSRAKPYSDRLQPMSRARSRSRTLCSFEPVKWMRCVPACSGPHDHQVDLRAAAAEPHRRLVRARGR